MSTQTKARGAVTRALREGTVAGDLARALVRGARPVFAALEERCFGNAPPALPPLFIVGLPRAGTTVVYQTICHCFRVSFVPELVQYAPIAPAFATWVAHKAHPEYRSTFTSVYGSSPGLASPSEGVMWNLWFDKDRGYENTDELSPAIAAAVVGTVGRVERIGGGPFVNKNLRNDQRVRLLAEMFPNSRFLIVVRDPFAVAKSLLLGRAALAGGFAEWFSIKPRDYESFRAAAPTVQVARQVSGLVRDLADDIRTVGRDRFAVVAYEDFCRDPARFTTDLETFMAHDSFVRRAAATDIAKPTGSRPVALDAAILDELRRAVEMHAPAECLDALECSWLGKT